MGQWRAKPDKLGVNVSELPNTLHHLLLYKSPSSVLCDSFIPGKDSSYSSLLKSSVDRFGMFASALR